MENTPHAGRPADLPGLGLSDVDSDQLALWLDELRTIKFGALSAANRAIPPGMRQFGPRDFGIDQIKTMIDRVCPGYFGDDGL